MRDAPTSQAEDFFRLGTRWNPQFHIAVQGWDANFIAQNSLGDVDIQIEQDIIPARTEEGMLLNLDFQVEIAVVRRGFRAVPRQPGEFEHHLRRRGMLTSF